MLLMLACMFAGTAYAQTGPPTNLRAKAMNQAVTLTWSPPMAGTAGRYNIYRAVAPAKGANPSSLKFMKINSTNQTSFQDKTISSGAIYVYYVTAVDGNGQESPRSNTVSVNLKSMGRY